jgi:PAS domain S-box-containing protein
MLSEAHPDVREAVRMRGISKAFGAVGALNQVDLTVYYGEIHALLGESGAGKTTLLRILRGVERPDFGNIEIRPEDGVAMVCQERSLVLTLSVAQNIFLNREPRNRFGFIDDDKAVRQAHALLEEFGLPVDPASPASELGVGQRQLIEIIKAVSQHSRILLLDEPTSALSTAEVERLFALLGRLSANGVAIIYVSHRMDEIMRIADRATILRSGKRVVTAKVSDLTLEMLIGYIIGGEGTSVSSLRESEQRFRQLAENIREVFWMLDPRTQRVLYVSPAFESVWGRSCESVYANARAFLEAVHEEDRPRVRAAYGDETEAEPPLEDEYRIVRPDGSIRWIRDRGFPIRDEAGQLYRVVRITEDITDRKRVESELQHSFEQLRALAARLQNIREEERTRVSREIHDELGQALTAIKMDLSSWICELTPEKAACPPRAAAILNLIDSTIKKVRRISTDLRPGILDDLGLVAAVEWACEEFESRTGTECYLDLPKSDIATDRERATALFRIFQETLTNVARHAGATELRVRLAEEEKVLRLELRDNGKGLDVGGLAPGESLGILGMRERALLLGGELTITGAAGLGTTVTARIPKVTEND